MDDKELNTQLAEIGNQIAKTSALWETSLQPIIKINADIHKSMEAFISPMAKSIADFKKNIEASLLPIGEQIKALQDSIAPAFEAFARAIEQLPEKTRYALMILAENGWYLDPNMSIPMLTEAAKLFTSGKKEEAHDLFCDYFEGRITAIDDAFNQYLPARGRLLSFAFKAHENEQYALSVPLFLAQADGICADITGVQLYSKDRRSGVPLLASVLLTSDVSPLTISILTPIIEPMPIIAGKNERAKLDNFLNRHTVLHGESTDYDNRLNSCRAISLLVYVEWVLRQKGVVNKSN